MSIEEIIRKELADKSEIEVSYKCGTTRTNSEYIDVCIGTHEVMKVTGANPSGFCCALAAQVELLKEEYPNLHVVEKDKEFHFYFPCFNSVCTRKVIVSISNKDPKSEVKKTGVVKESYSLVDTKKVMEVIAKYPDYELYRRRGFGFRGAQERRTDIEGIKKLCAWAAAIDVKVIDNEIHVNGFSVSDMD